MERGRRVWRQFLTLTYVALCINSCTQRTDPELGHEIEINLKCHCSGSKAMLPDEDLISDISLMIFNENGELEDHHFMDDGSKSVTVNLLKGMKYSILVCANFGYRVLLERFEDRDKVEFHLAYPDEYKKGIPMSACLEDVVIKDDTIIEIELERLMACISLKMDRSRLSDGVKMDVIGIRIGNCPKSAKVFSDSKVESEDQCFNVGFRHDDIDCIPLNREDIDRMSQSISLYMLENMQGRFAADGLHKDEEKVLAENDPRRHTCSYIEIELEYEYRDSATTDSPLIYRFYLGEGLNSLDIERNSHYHIIVRPEDDGLDGEGWRVDKSGIGFIGKPVFKQYPSDYIVGNIGDKIHIGCELTPLDTPFDIGLEYLEADKKRGIYDYVIDTDGHGVTLTLKAPGSGLIYMEAGDPINDAALFLIEVNLPDI